MIVVDVYDDLLIDFWSGVNWFRRSSVKKLPDLEYAILVDYQKLYDA